MKIPSSGADIRMDGNFQSDDFQIALSGHTFKILSSGLYSDKIRAIIRELSCNAYDAHVVAGKPEVPFLLCLPNTIAPVFKIRDYGDGIPPEKIKEVYTVYFSSTKQDSENEVGCFGLGSKSPFAYTKKFTIVSFRNGKRHHYSAIINEKGFPNIIKIAETDTDEPNGLEVSFSVKSYDFADFRTKAELVLRPFSTHPEIHGSTSYRVSPLPSEDHILVQGEDWTLYKENSYGAEGTRMAVMGNVEYPYSYQSKFSPVATMLAGLNLRLECPLGSFMMTPSRESVDWEDFSVNYFNDRLETIYDELLLEVENQISNAKTYWEAAMNTRRILNASCLRKLSINPTWKGRAVKSTMNVTAGVKCTEFTASRPRSNAKTANSCDSRAVSRIFPRETTFYLDDFTNANRRIGNHVRDNLSRDQSVYLISADTSKSLKEFLKEIGISYKDLVLASSVPKRVRTYTGVGGRKSRLAGTKARAFTFSKTTYNGASPDSYWDPAEVDLNAPILGVYVEIRHYKPVSERVSNDNDSIKELILVTKPLGISIDTIVGVKTVSLKKFQEATNWIELGEFLDNRVVEVWNTVPDAKWAFEFFHYREQYHRKKEYNGMDNWTDLKYVEGIEFLCSNHKIQFTDDAWVIKFGKTMKRISDQKTRAGQLHTLFNIMKLFGIKGITNDGIVMPTGKDGKPIDYGGKIRNRYPMMRYMAESSRYWWRTNRNVDDVIAYIELVDNKAEVKKEEKEAA